MYQAGLVLEGGGMKGVYTAGVLDFFTEKGIDFSHIYGVSARCMPYVQLSVQTKGTGAECQCGLSGYETVLQPGKLIDQRRFVQCGFLLSPDSGLPVSV